ncbi:MAG TPA: caspase family protein [Candidatus Aquilonibacter sp.]|nr:caspase family protein [Candidatus Aquilonibacter sp.]
MQRIARASLVLLAAGLLGNAAFNVAHAQARCGAGKDLVVQALERVQANSGPDQLGDADQLLKRAIELCSDLGEAWYYRSLVEARLGHTQVAAYAMQQAQLFPSDALNEGLNPFVLSTPHARGLETASTPGQPTPSNGPPQKWALVIGIASFEDKVIPPLSYTASDAKSFADVLLSPKYGQFKPENVHILLNEQATTRHIKEQLNWLARSAAPNDIVVVYVAAHGSPREVDTAGVSYIITHDTDIGTDPDNPDIDSLYATALPMVDLANAIATRVRAERTAIFLDTCFSGNLAQPDKRLMVPGLATGSVSPSTLNQIRQGTGRIIFAASGVNQESLESDAIKHGYFTYYLVQALEQQNGSIPLSQAFSYVQQHVESRAQSEAHTQQDPVMSRSEDNTDFSLGGAAASNAGNIQPRPQPSGD